MTSAIAARVLQRLLAFKRNGWPVCAESPWSITIMKIINATEDTVSAIAVTVFVVNHQALFTVFFNNSQ